MTVVEKTRVRSPFRSQAVMQSYVFLLDFKPWEVVGVCWMMSDDEDDDRMLTPSKPLRRRT